MFWSTFGLLEAALILEAKFNDVLDPFLSFWSPFLRFSLRFGFFRTHFVLWPSCGFGENFSFSSNSFRFRANFQN